MDVAASGADLILVAAQREMRWKRSGIKASILKLEMSSNWEDLLVMFYWIFRRLDCVLLWMRGQLVDHIHM